MEYPFRLCADSARISQNKARTRPPFVDRPSAAGLLDSQVNTLAHQEEGFPSPVGEGKPSFLLVDVSVAAGQPTTQRACAVL
jgi:hypothetical protein